MKSKDKCSWIINIRPLGRKSVYHDSILHYYLCDEIIIRQSSYQNGKYKHGLMRIGYPWCRVRKYREIYNPIGCLEKESVQLVHSPNTKYRVTTIRKKTRIMNSNLKMGSARCHIDRQQMNQMMR